MHIIVIVGFLFLSLELIAQNDTCYIVDATGLEPVAFATLQCITPGAKGSVTFFTSDEKGRVRVCPCNKADSVKWKVRHLNYLPFDTIISCNNSIDTLFLQLRHLDIDQIIVSEKYTGIKLVNDTVRFDLNHFRKPHQRDIRELLKSLPGIVIDAQGKITYQSRPVNIILLGGKSVVRNQFEILNKTISTEDLDMLQLFPSEHSSNNIDQTMTLDIVLSPEIQWLGQIQGRLTTQMEIEADFSIIKTADKGWNHAVDFSSSQIPDQHRPQINLLLEFYDKTNKHKNELNIQKSIMPGNPAFNDEFQKDRASYMYYNGLYENKKTELNIYLRHLNADRFKASVQKQFNIQTIENIWTEQRDEIQKNNNSLASIYFSHKPNPKMHIISSAKFSKNLKDLANENTLSSIPINMQSRQWNETRSSINAVVFSLVSWQIDSTWNFKTAIELNKINEKENYDFKADSSIYNIPFDTQILKYNALRTHDKINLAARISHNSYASQQKTALLFNYNIIQLSDSSNFNNVRFESPFILPQTLRTFFESGMFVTHDIHLTKFHSSIKLGVSYFQSNEISEKENQIRPNASLKLSYKVSNVHSLYLNYSSIPRWLDRNSLSLTARPINFQTYALTKNFSQFIIDRHQWTIGLREFSRSKENFAHFSLSYQYKPVHYVRRQSLGQAFNVDTLVAETNFNQIKLSLSRFQKIGQMPIFFFLSASRSYSFGTEFLAGQKIVQSNQQLNITIDDILANKFVNLSLNTKIDRLIWSFEPNVATPAQWNGLAQIKIRYLVNKWHTWFSSELGFLFRGSIYNEKLINLSIEKKWFKNFSTAVAVENLLNLNSNIRKNRFISSALFLETQQNVFGGRLFITVKYKL